MKILSTKYTQNVENSVRYGLMVSPVIHKKKKKKKINKS